MESEEGVGSEFRVELPMPKGERKIRQGSEFRDKRVIVIGDTAPHSQAVAEQLQMLGLNVTVGKISSLVDCGGAGEAIIFCRKNMSG